MMGNRNSVTFPEQSDALLKYNSCITELCYGDFMIGVISFMLFIRKKDTYQIADLYSLSFQIKTSF